MDKEQDGPGKVSAQAESENRHPLVLSPHTAWRGLPFPVNAFWPPLMLICSGKAPHLDSLQVDQHASVIVYQDDCCPSSARGRQAVLGR